MTASDSLTSRLESAEAGSRELDREMALATGVLLTGVREDGVWGVKEGRWTQSLDAALALAERVLPGWAWSASGPDPMTSLYRDAFACLAAPHDNGAVEPWNVERDVCTATAKTPPLALCTAILKANKPRLAAAYGTFWLALVAITVAAQILLWTE